MMKTGIELIAEERQEQLEKHNWSNDHDDDHKQGELEKVAAYLLTKNKDYFPDWDLKYFKKFEAKEGIERLKVAGALIAAEIDRLQRLEK